MTLCLKYLGGQITSRWNNIHFKVNLMCTNFTYCFDKLSCHGRSKVDTYSSCISLFQMFVFLLLFSPITSSTPCDFQHCSENGGSVFHIWYFCLIFGMVYFGFNVLDLILSVLSVFFSLVFLMMIMSSCTICVAIPLGCEIS